MPETEPGLARTALNRFDLLEHDIHAHGEAAATRIRDHTRRITTLEHQSRTFRIQMWTALLVLLVGISLVAGIAIQGSLK